MMDLHELQLLTPEELANRVNKLLADDQDFMFYKLDTAYRLELIEKDEIKWVFEHWDEWSLWIEAFFHFSDQKKSQSIWSIRSNEGPRKPFRLPSSSPMDEEPLDFTPDLVYLSGHANAAEHQDRNRTS